MKWLILILQILSSSLLLAKDYWKHNEQQGKVGACHAFATIALVEAEYWKATGKYINLSERELFMRHYQQGFKNPSELISSHLQAAAKQKLPEQYKESGHIKNNFALLKAHGVSSERELPYNPIFSNGTSMSVHRLRHQRDLLSREAELLRQSQQWSPQVARQKLSEHQSKLKGLDKAFAIPTRSNTRQWTRDWLRHYSLKVIKPKTTSAAKALIIEQLAHHPVAVDVSNFPELTNKQSYATNYTRHSFIVSHYDPASDQFTIRSSTHKGSRKVSANALSRGTYQLYYLEKTSS